MKHLVPLSPVLSITTTTAAVAIPLFGKSLLFSFPPVADGARRRCLSCCLYVCQRVFGVFHGIIPTPLLLLLLDGVTVVRCNEVEYTLSGGKQKILYSFRKERLSNLIIPSRWLF